MRFWSVVVLGLGLDLWSKSWAFQTLRQGGHRVLVPNILEFHTTLNPGALFGIGAGRTGVFLLASVLALVLVLWMFVQSPRQRWLMHVALGAILAGALGNMYDRVFVQLVPLRISTPAGSVARYFVAEESPDGQWTLFHEYPPGEDYPPRALPRSADGAVTRPIGYVRDFIKIPTRWFGEREMWPWVFNVADMLLVGGVGILALRLLTERHACRTAATTELDAPTGK